MTLLRRATPPAADGAIQRIDPFSVGWDWVDMAVHRLARGQAIERNADDRERLVLVIEGRANVAIDGETLGLQGSRETVFDGPPAPVVLVQPGCGFTLTAASDALVVVAAAPGGPIRRNAVIPPDEIFVERSGRLDPQAVADEPE